MAIAEGSVRGGEVADVEQARIATDRLGFLANQLHPVVVHRVVAGGHHDAAGGLAVEGLEIDLLGATHANIDNVASTRRQTLDGSLHQGGAAEADVVSNHYRPRAQQRSGASADTAGKAFIQFIWNATTDVIGLETRERHQCSPYTG